MIRRMPLVVLLCLGFGAARLAAQEPWDSVGTILKASPVPVNGYKRFGLPRSDLTVRMGAVTVATPLVAGGWVGFAGDPGQATMMGDLVVTAAELRPVLAQLAQDSIDVTAIHNHVVGEIPRLVYVHVHAAGAATALAARVARAMAKTAIRLPARAAAPGPVTIDTGKVFGALGLHGRGQGAVATIGTNLVPGTVSMDGATLVPAMAYGTPIAIQQVTPGRWFASGDFAVPAAKVAAVRNALLAAGITPTAEHTHMIGESPTVYFIHFWADGTPDAVLGGLRAALDAAR